MARASWKYHPFSLTEVEQFSDYLTEGLYFIKNKPKRNITITKLNYFHEFNIYTGKWLIEKSLTKYHFGFKLGMLTKTRKPYYFRSKKKKSVTKKYSI